MKVWQQPALKFSFFPFTKQNVGFFCNISMRILCQIWSHPNRSFANFTTTSNLELCSHSSTLWQRPCLVSEADVFSYFTGKVIDGHVACKVVINCALQVTHPKPSCSNRKESFDWTYPDQCAEMEGRCTCWRTCTCHEVRTYVHCFWLGPPVTT